MVSCNYLYSHCVVSLNLTCYDRGIFLTGSSLLGASVKAPRVRSKNLVSIIFCEATAIYGVIIAIILQSKMNQPALRNVGEEPINEVALYFAGYAVFGAGIAVGLTNIASGYVVILLAEERVNVLMLFVTVVYRLVLQGAHVFWQMPRMQPCMSRFSLLRFLQVLLVFLVSL